MTHALVEWVAEIVPVSVTSRRMMGGWTLYGDGAVFAIVADDLLWFKADAVSDAEWDAAEAPRFTYDMRGKTGSMNYRRAPEDCYDDAQALSRWASLALEAGVRAAAAKARPRRGARSAAG